MIKKIIFFLLITICLKSYAQNVIVDPTFTVGSGFNGEIYTTLIQSDGKIIVGGHFLFLMAFQEPELLD